MTFRVLAVASAALFASFGAAHAQSLQVGAAPDRVVVDIAGKPMPLVRAELFRASEAVCKSDDALAEAPSTECVDATYERALLRAHALRSTPAVARAEQVASR